MSLEKATEEDRTYNIINIDIIESPELRYWQTITTVSSLLIDFNSSSPPSTPSLLNTKGTPNVASFKQFESSAIESTFCYVI